jgi:cold shock CspA family protein
MVAITRDHAEDIQVAVRDAFDSARCQLYFSRENVVHSTFEQLAPGAEVQFIEEMAAEGPQAKRVSAGKHGAG